MNLIYVNYQTTEGITFSTFKWTNVEGDIQF